MSPAGRRCFGGWRRVGGAGAVAGLSARVTRRTFRYCFVTHLLEARCDIRTAQELLGHTHVRTTMVQTHVLNRGGRGVRSPLDGGAVRPG